MEVLNFDIQRFADIHNSTSDTVITGTADADSIYNTAGNVTINALGGNDTITNSFFGDTVSISGGEGNDNIFNECGRYVTVNGGAGDDYICNVRHTVKIPRLNDSLISDSKTYVYGSSNDFLGLVPDYYSEENLYGRNVLMSGGDGNDTVESEGGDTVTLDGGNNNDILIGSNANQDIFVYNAGNDTVQNYQSGETLRFGATYTGWTTDNNDLIINAAEGSVRINEAKNKLVEVADGEGNIAAHVFIASDYEGAIDGRGYGGFEVISGSDNVSNQIYAGESGSSLWGGNNSNDDLYGNVGIDEYIYSYGNGNDNIFQSGNEDTVNLNGISLGQIVGAEINGNGVYLKFTDGGSLNINGQVGTFILEGQRYGANYQDKTWYAK